jgi:hypothetical protein
MPNGQEEEYPLWAVLWTGTVHTVLSTIYFVLITCLAVAIDLGLHWFETLTFVRRYGLSPIIRWEVELMAYTLATVDCFLFVRALIKPLVVFLNATWRSKNESDPTDILGDHKA